MAFLVFLKFLGILMLASGTVMILINYSRPIKPVIFWIKLALLGYLVFLVSLLAIDIAERNYVRLVIDILIPLFLFFGGPTSRRRIAKLIGAKARALRDKLVKSMKPVRSPMPQPA